MGWPVGATPALTDGFGIITTRPMLTARQFLIGGRVQGVGFRFFAEEVAAREGLRGYVRNLLDGRVEALVEGDTDAVERFELAIRRGPRGSRVDVVDVIILTPTGRVGGFAIRP